jgi:biopolymer transport protein TolR
MSMHLAGAGQRAEINVTPMIDVLLVLIIIFMMIPQEKMHGEEAEVPHPATSATAEPQPERTVVVELHGDGQSHTSVSINHQPVAWENLQQTLKDIYKQRAEKILFLRGDKDIFFEDAARVIGAAHDADPGIQVGLISQTAGGD